MSEWLDLSDNANCFKQAYVEGFVDISGGSIITRGPNDGIVIGGDSSLNGTVYLGDSIFVRSDGFVAPGDASNGATPFYVDASYSDINGREVVSDLISYDISGNATNGAPVSSVSLPATPNWTQLGSDIYGEASGDKSGHSVSSVDSKTYGRVVAIGSKYNHGTTTNSYCGHVRVYQYRQYTSVDVNKYHHASRVQDTTQTKPLIITSTTPLVGNYYWIQLGADIDGESGGDQSGQSVSLVDSSANGLVVAIGAQYNSGNRGHVRVYQYDATKTTAETDQTLATYGPVGWNRLGGDIDGQVAGDYSGYSVSLANSSEYGLVVAVSSIRNYAGNIIVYKYDATKETGIFTDASANFGPVGWSRLGETLSTTYTGLVYTVSLLDTATYGIVIAMGNPDGTQGVYKVFNYDANKTTASTGSTDFGPVGWRRLGVNIGPEYFDRSGWAVSLAYNTAYGLVVAVGALQARHGTNTNISEPGNVRIYQYRKYTSADADKYHYTSRERDTGQLKPLILTEATNIAPSPNTYYWTQLGADIDGDTTNGRWGASVSLLISATNDIVVAIAGRNASSTQQGNSWRKIYRYDQNQTTTPVGWRQIGDLRESPGMLFPSPPEDTNQTMSLAEGVNGLVVAVGVGNGDTQAVGYVRVYEIPYTKTYSDVSGGFLDVQVIGGYLNDGLTSAALYVNGDTDLSGGLIVRGDVSFNAGNLFVAGDLSLNGNLFINSFAPNSIGADAIDSTVDIEFTNKLSVSVADLSFSTTGLQVATDFNSNNTPINLAANLTVPANIAIVDGSNGTVYGSYLTLTNKDATAYYNVGKSASGIFNIVDQANAGVYLASGGTSFTGTSDARLKTNIAPLESATDKIMALNPCTYQWKSEVESTNNTTNKTQTHIGFIAQEVEKVMPELVHPIDHTAGSDYKGVNTTDLIPYLVRTIQEQNEMIESLYHEISALESSQN